MNEYMLFRHYPSGRCRDCELFDGHSNACIDAAPLRMIDELRKELSEVKKVARKLVENDGAGAHYDASVALKARERLRALLGIPTVSATKSECNCGDGPSNHRFGCPLGPKPSCLHDWEVDGDRDVCKRCGSRTNPVI